MATRGVAGDGERVRPGGRSGMECPPAFSVEARGKRAQSARIGLDRVTVRNDDSPEIVALRATLELLHDVGRPPAYKSVVHVPRRCFIFQRFVGRSRRHGL